MQARMQTGAGPEEFTRDLAYVIYGVSRSQRGFGYQVAESMLKRGYSVSVIHPSTDRIGPWITKHHVSEVEPAPDVAILCSPSSASRSILSDLHEAGVNRVLAWKGSVDRAGVEFARQQNMNLQADCPLLHMEGMGFPHNLHARLRQWFGAERGVLHA